MKKTKLINALMCMLLCMCYFVAYIGFDLHIDNHEGRVYVVSLLGGTDCETVHPDDICHCVAHHHGDCECEDEDCENDIEVLTIAGDGYFCHFDLSPVATAVVLPAEPAPCVLPDGGYFRTPLLVKGPPRALLSDICVLRV